MFHNLNQSSYRNKLVKTPTVFKPYIERYPIEGIHQDKDGTLKGRYVIGEAVITPVTIGSGTGITTPLIDEIYAMTTILE